MMRLTPLPAFQDNDLWFLHDGRRSRGVDPGNAQPVLEGLQREGLQLEAILVTRHHPDHAGGVDALGDEKFAALPREARDCCTHEYTLSNLRFAPAAEPGNLQLINFSKRCKERLRTRDEAVAQAARGHDAATAPDEGGACATLRQWNNAFR